MLLKNLIAGIQTNVELIDNGTNIAYLTRQSYYERFGNNIQPSQYVAQLHYNITTDSINIANTQYTSITSQDVFFADDWFGINVHPAIIP